MAKIYLSFQVYDSNHGKAPSLLIQIDYDSNSEFLFFHLKRQHGTERCTSFKT